MSKAKVAEKSPQIKLTEPATGADKRVFKKFCPECDQEYEVAGGRVGKCPKGHPFQKKESSRTTTTKQPAVDPVAIITAARKLMEEAGGREKAIALVEAVGKLIESTGGKPDKAKEVINALG